MANEDEVPLVNSSRPLWIVLKIILAILTIISFIECMLWLRLFWSSVIAINYPDDAQNIVRSSDNPKALVGIAISKVIFKAPQYATGVELILCKSKLDNFHVIRAACVLSIVTSITAIIILPMMIVLAMLSIVIDVLIVLPVSKMICMMRQGNYA